jgi:hypothetical protein
MPTSAGAKQCAPCGKKGKSNMTEETEYSYKRLVERAEQYFRARIALAAQRNEYIHPFAELWIADLTRIRTQETCEEAEAALNQARRKRCEIMRQWGRQMNQPDPKAMANEIRRLPDLDLRLTPSEAFVLLAQLQLALRHPGNTGVSSDVAREIAKKLQAHLQGPVLEYVAELGWNPDFDVPREAE